METEISYGDLRVKFYTELKEKLEKSGSKAILKYSSPTNGETIKLNGIVLYKVTRSSNPWGYRGIVIYKRLTDSALKLVGGVRSKDKKRWVGCALTEINYSALMEMLLETAVKAKIVRTKSMKEAKKIIEAKKKII